MDAIEMHGAILRIDNAVIRGNGNTIQGNGNTVHGNNCIVQGNNNQLHGNCGVMQGNNNMLYGNGGTVQGLNSRAQGSSNQVSGFSMNSFLGIVGDVSKKKVKRSLPRESAQSRSKPKKDSASIDRREATLTSIAGKKRQRAVQRVPYGWDHKQEITALVDGPSIVSLAYDRKRAADGSAETMCCGEACCNIANCKAEPCGHAVYCVRCARSLCYGKDGDMHVAVGTIGCPECAVHATAIALAK